MADRFPSQLWSYLRRRWISVRRVRFWLLVLLAVYTLAGFFVVPWIAGMVAVDTVREDFERELSLGDVDANPYTLSLEITDLALADRDGHRLLDFDRLRVNFTVASLWERAWTFQKVSLDGLVVREERLPSGETRFTRLAGEASGQPANKAAPAEPAAGAMPGVVIRELGLAGATLRFVDHLDESATAELELRDVRATVEDARLHESSRFPVRLAARSAAGGELRFDGGMQLSPAFALDGELRVDALTFAPAEPYLRELVGVRTESGSASLDGRVSISADGPLVYRGDAGVADLSIVPVDDDEPLASWRALEIEGLDLSTAPPSVEAARVGLERPVIREERFASGETRVTRLMETAAGKAEQPEEAAQPKAAEEGGDAGMPAVAIGELDVRKGVIHFVDHLSPDPGKPGATATFAVRSLEVSAEDAALHESRPFPVHLAGELDAGGAFSFDGDLRLLPAFAGDGDLRVEELALGPAEPYVQQIARVAIAGGSVSVDGRVSVSPDELLAYRGSAGVTDLSVVPLDTEEPVIGWRALRIEQLDLSAGQGSVEASRVAIDGASGRVVIREDQSTNIDRLLLDSAGGEDSASGAGDAEAAPPLRISVAGIALANSTLRFADRSLPLPFSARIHELGGEISTLATDTQEPAEVQLEGQVGEHGLARVAGRIHAWQPMRDTNLTLTFRNLEVPAYSPYTVAFAGRRIAGGRMDLDLSYAISGERLEGRNSIALYDLELGEKVDSPGAMDLPLGFAVALLKNSEGVIELAIPVTGDVGDPQFELGGAIRKAVTGVIGKVVSSPFRFLAGLVGAGDEDLGRIAFSPGRSDLTPPQKERVALLRKALADRPKLAIELAGPFDADVDGPALKRQRAVKELAAKLREPGREVASPDLTAESTQEAMEALFASAYPDTSLDEVRERFTRPAEEVPEGHSRLDGLAYRAHLAERVIAAQPVTDADLAVLGRVRAAAVRDRLLAHAPGSGEGGTAVEPDRVLLADAASVESENDDRVVMEVGLAVD
ncbi:DUF748 domain-containing protein [Thiohalorhabdus sp.]|uniref:DUF748 domain-containing protein n=1 Tax=Thiohalorhabdus sp. TaxID=3094134 RepID=UPI002FC2830B